LDSEDTELLEKVDIWWRPKETKPKKTTSRPQYQWSTADVYDSFEMIET
jgi:hypothetical protein